ncbi:hypothetical protein ACP0HM_03035 [Escherichia coli]
MPQLIDNLLSVRTNISTIFLFAPRFVSIPIKRRKCWLPLMKWPITPMPLPSWITTYSAARRFASGNPIYGLILNGMKGLYTRIGRHYFANPEARSLALGFYHKLSALCSEGAHDQVYETVRRYGHESGEIWHRMQKKICRVI